MSGVRPRANPSALPGAKTIRMGPQKCPTLSPTSYSVSSPSAIPEHYLTPFEAISTEFPTKTKFTPLLSERHQRLAQHIMATSINLFPHNMGDEDGPLAADHYKRAVLRAPPSRFAIEFLPPTKLGGGSTYSYGMRISPISRGERASISSNGSNSEYDVWRRWEDCLWLQDGLELEARVSRKTGFYLQDQAASWESLPPGPDPNSVAQDIHDYIPKLTKRGTIFRTSMATIEQRDAELQAFVEALFKEDQPALIKEMRSTRLVTDFFGYWHRDNELASRKQKARARESRESLTPSLFSSYFSASSTSSLVEGKDGRSHSSPVKRPFLRARASSTSSERPHSIASSQFTENSTSTITGPSRPSPPPSVATTRRRALSVTSSSGSSSSQDDYSDTMSVASIPRSVEEVPIIFGQNSQLHSNPHSRPTSGLDALQEESEDVVAPLAQQETIQRKMNGRRNRSCQIYVTPPVTPSTAASESPRTPAGYDRSIRESWATIDSTTTYLEGLHIGFPTSPNGYRQSMASIRTFMTTDSAEAVIPRSPLLSDDQDKSRARPRASVPVSLSDFDMYPDVHDEDEIDSLYDAFPRPASFIPERPETPVPHGVGLRLNITDSFIPGPPSPTTSVSTTFSAITAMSGSTTTSISTTLTSSTASSGDGNTLSIKAALNNAIVMLRVSRDIELTELRQRVFNKFVGQEGVPLSKGFTIAVVVAHKNSPIAQLREPANGTRKRSTSVTSVDNPDMRIVDSQLDWETVAYSTEGTKLTLRILDTPA
ncbi:hypothetical protein NP233_g5139 [Leucocoprinus birnbaumii]|uniref:PX domain-containing protein n=1 Tax=Leucocoprinus birnbaumii TaxID=56174 RepID=A0AAD5VX21_9AGAR|nr:hypothetical protein NP233_g5139 [Leucocoprinus birnbaumii]